MSIEVDINGLGSGGDGVARLEDGRVVFVPGGIPGDRLEVSLSEVRKKVQYATLERVITPSPQRVTPRCSLSACGGCSLRELQYQGQSEAKKQRIIDNLRRIGGFQPEDLAVDFHAAPSPWNYRHRVRLHTRWSGQGWILGFYEKGSRQLVPYAGCPVMWPELEKAVGRLSQALHRLGREARLVEVRLTYSRIDQRVAGFILSEGSMEAFRGDLEWVEASGLSGLEVHTQDARWSHGNLELSYDHAKSDEFSITYEPSLFTQANPEVNDALVQAVVRAVRPANSPKVLELHSGIGNFSIPLARAGAQVTSFESNQRAAVLAGRNARAAGVQIDTHGEPDIAAISHAKFANILVLDPPRVGAKEVCRAIRADSTAIERIVYVSCDSATLARDLKSLGQNGFRLLSIAAFDMFPQTPHVESLAILAR